MADNEKQVVATEPPPSSPQSGGVDRLRTQEDGGSDTNAQLVSILTAILSQLQRQSTILESVFATTDDESRSQREDTRSKDRSDTSILAKPQTRNEPVTKTEPPPAYTPRPYTPPARGEEPMSKEDRAANIRDRGRFKAAERDPTVGEIMENAPQADTPQEAVKQRRMAERLARLYRKRAKRGGVLPRRDQQKVDEYEEYFNIDDGKPGGDANIIDKPPANQPNAAPPAKAKHANGKQDNLAQQDDGVDRNGPSATTQTVSPDNSKQASDSSAPSLDRLADSMDQLSASIEAMKASQPTPTADRSYQPTQSEGPRIATTAPAQPANGSQTDSLLSQILSAINAQTSALAAIRDNSSSGVIA